MLFDQSAWLKQFPGFFEDGNPARKRFSSYAEVECNKFITALIVTMGAFYGGTHHFLPKDKTAAANESEIANQVRNFVLPAWRHGLSDCSVSQILAALFLVIGGKTEHIDFPPASVLKFKAICTASRPAYHDVVQNPTEAPRLGWDKEAAQKKTAAIQKSAMIRILQTLKESNLQNAKDRRTYSGNYGAAQAQVRGAG
jgi:hypothetical protein